MTLYFEEEGESRLDIPCEDLAREVAEETLEYTGCPYEAQVNVLLTTNGHMKEMNEEFRGIGRPTDVLSFPMAEYGHPGDFGCLDEQDGCFDPESGELVLGDIVISKEKVISQAEEFGHSVKREYAFLIAHSMLHLIGYDHMEEEERLDMEARQKEILDRLNILR
ncbi:rRNA maturation RNase YbeY [Dorea sp. D27]|uniref:rRNA maturation RNase YbeY n=1 Tax=Dorea sp. D27 TaxID=658665 RepID=UPI0006738DBF|nr:rRNA maturation RNase YbeY [Dorea sp. D27]KMZ55022.1 putative metalloprotease [Dorea sp. D27]